MLFPLPGENNQIFYDLGGIFPFYRLSGKMLLVLTRVLEVLTILDGGAQKVSTL